MLDFHTHILPGMDDGAKSPEISAQMLQMLDSQGCEAVVLTPHFYPNDEPLSSFLRRRDRALTKLLNAPLNKSILYLGAEVALSSLLFSNEDLRPACLSGTNLMLTELSYTNSLQEKTFQMLDRLIYDYGIQPVIAHLERYPDSHKSPAGIERLLKMGCLIQLNASAFYGSFLKTRWAYKLLDRGVVHFIGSDCHNLDTRAPNMQLALIALSQKAPKSMKALEDSAQRLTQMATPIHLEHISNAGSEG